MLRSFACSDSLLLVVDFLHLGAPLPKAVLVPPAGGPGGGPGGLGGAGGPRKRELTASAPR